MFQMAIDLIVKRRALLGFATHTNQFNHLLQVFLSLDETNKQQQHLIHFFVYFLIENN